MFINPPKQTNPGGIDGERAALPLWITERATKFFQLFEPQGAKIIDKSIKYGILFGYAESEALSAGRLP